MDIDKLGCDDPFEDVCCDASCVFVGEPLVHICTVDVLLLAFGFGFFWNYVVRHKQVVFQLVAADESKSVDASPILQPLVSPPCVGVLRRLLVSRKPVIFNAVD